MNRTCTLALGTVLLCLAGTNTAFAHATLETKEAPADGFYKAVIRIGHGCEGTATTSIRVQIPEGVIAVKPMPKPGWQLTTKEGHYAQAYDYYDEKLTKGVTEVSWAGGSLPDAWYDEFVFRAKLPNSSAGTVIYFPIVQQCEKGVHRWIEIPEPGKTADDYKEPAPGVTLTAKP